MARAQGEGAEVEGASAGRRARVRRRDDGALDGQGVTVGR